jgi:hypothetical protein
MLSPSITAAKTRNRVVDFTGMMSLELVGCDMESGRFSPTMTLTDAVELLRNIFFRGPLKRKTTSSLWAQLAAPPAQRLGRTS